MNASPRRALLAALLAAGCLGAQDPSTGMFLGIPAALSLDAGAAGQNPGQILIKPNGFQLAAPTPWSAPTAVGFDLAAIMARTVCGAVSGIDVDDFSLGLDWILANDTNGRIFVPQNRWAVVTFSVTRGTVGRAGSRVALEAAGPGGAGSDLFSYLLPGSALPAPLVGKVDRAHDMRELGLGGIANADIDGLDHFVPMFALEPGMVAMLPQNPSIYFTVANASLAVPGVAGWFGSTPPSGATILEVRFTAAGGWSCPRVWMTFRDLGLRQEDDIDGLAIDLLRQRILLSVRNPAQRVPPLDPILFVYYGTDLAAPVPYAKQDGTPVSSEVGLLQNDDVDAICSMDPSVRVTGGPQAPAWWFSGVPRQPVLAATPTIHASAFRNFDRATNRMVFDTWMVGWPPVGGAAPGLAAVFLTFGNSLQLFPLAPLYLRTVPTTFAGGPLHYGLEVPLNFSLTGIDATFRWLAADSRALVLAEAWPIGVNL